MSEPTTPLPTSDGGRSHFEFGPTDERVIAQLALRMRIVGSAMIVLGLIELRELLQADIASLLFSMPFLLVGYFTFRASGSFGSIVHMDNADISHLMAAMRSLHRVFTIAAGFIALLVVIVSLTLGFALYVGLT